MVRPERLVYDHSGAADGSADFRGIVTFVAEGSRTRLSMRTLFPSADIREFINREYHAVEGAEQTLGRLADYLAGQMG